MSISEGRAMRFDDVKSKRSIERGGGALYAPGGGRSANCCGGDAGGDEAD
jgi:hypothetical protein